MLSLIVQVSDMPEPDHSVAAGRAHAIAWHGHKRLGDMLVAQGKLTHQSRRPPSLSDPTCQVRCDPGLQQTIVELAPTQTSCSTLYAALRPSMGSDEPKV